jgi:hypothetical protein
MNRLYAAVFVAAITGCGPKNPESLCNTVPAPAACQQACDPTPGAANTCPGGYHCSPDGTCDLQCTQGGGECPEGFTCSTDGYCNNDETHPPDVDANCPAVHFTPVPTIPSILLVLDRSGSMTTTDIAPNRYAALDTALFGANGAVTTKEAQVYFGEELFSGDQSPCNDGPPGSLNVTGHSADRALNNAAVMKTLTESAANAPSGNTPTAAALGQAYADFAATPPPPGSPPIVLLATDGEPNGCNGGNDNNRSPNAAATAYTNGIRTFIIGLAGLNTGFLQQMANAGAGTTNAPYYTANNPASLVTAFNTIISGVISCDLTINAPVDQGSAMAGQVTLNGTVLTYGSDWTLDPDGTTIHIMGAACDTLKNTPNAVVDAAFPCGSVISREATGASGLPHSTAAN